MTAIFDSISQPVAERAAAGFARIALAIRSHDWAAGEVQGLTPTQANLLRLLATLPLAERRPATLAARLQVTRPTVSDALAALERKGLIGREPDARDRRQVAVELSGSGRAAARAAGDRPEFLSRALEAMPEPAQIAILRGLVGVIRGLQLAGDIPVQRMCVTCRFFRPYAHPDPSAPHHCAFVDAPFGDRHLRLDCPEQEAADVPMSAALWARFERHPPAQTQETGP